MVDGSTDIGANIRCNTKKIKNSRNGSSSTMEQRARWSGISCANDKRFEVVAFDSFNPRTAGCNCADIEVSSTGVDSPRS